MISYRLRIDEANRSHFSGLLKDFTAEKVPCSVPLQHRFGIDACEFYQFVNRDTLGGTVGFGKAMHSTHSDDNPQSRESRGQ